MDYSKLGLNERMRREGGLAAKPSTYELAIDNDLIEEKNPLKQNIIVTKQLYQSTLGGSVQFVDATGGTVILSYDPYTGTITLNGGVIIQQTLNIGTINSALFTGGTITSSVFTGTINNATLGTPAITGGTATSSTLNNVIIGTGAATGGTYNSVVAGTPTITGGNWTSGTLANPVVTGTATLPVNAGSSTLSTNGNIAIQTHGTAGILAIRVGGTTFYFNPTGTI